ncbi:Major facilitator superfamily domain, general substrate transporter [Penicillium italicum]|uniref:Major facilitator superfamily domain, general substrate transporter n=1 Tax=Penicillium italicum TaxID=40296 RepID=A0A0A2KT27_PENIT|nr:Major facilitator superfamily domain, general substrate transporter [Penicillium italicum]
MSTMEKPSPVYFTHEMVASTSSFEMQELKEHDPNSEVKARDHLNPRNWSSARKTMLFVSLMTSSLLADGAMVWGGTLVTEQAMDWNMSTAHSATSMNYGILLQGFGGIFAVPLIEAYGRLPIWLWPQVITMFMVLGATLSNDWSTFTAFRSLQGLFGTVPQVIGLPIIHDMYTSAEWPRMINVWGTTFLVGPFLGPAIAGYIAAGSDWRTSFGVLTAIYGVSTAMVILFGYETYYEPGRTTKQSRLASYFGSGNTTLPKGSTLSYWSRTVVVYVFKFPLLMTGMAILVTFTWPIGITTTIDAFLHSPPYLFDTIEASSMRFAGVIGALCGTHLHIPSSLQILTISIGWAVGHFFNGWIFKRHSSTWRTELRLHGVWFPIASMASGLLTYGLTMHFGKHWLGIAIGWIMVNIGMVATIVAISAYALEKYPEQATCVSAILNMWRTCGGFAVGYFQPAWIQRNGLGLVFGIQAAILCVAVALTITPVFLWERKRRLRVNADA